MDVRCPKCETLYELDAAQLKSPVVTLKCSQCAHVFRFETHARPIQENQRRWMVRNRATGDILYLNGFDVLHQWIMEGKAKRDDEISRTGEKWIALGEIGEFMPIFQVVDSISSITGEAPRDLDLEPPKPAADLPPQPQRPERKHVRTVKQYGGATEQYGGATEEVTRNERPSRPTPAAGAPKAPERPMAPTPGPSAAPKAPKPAPRPAPPKPAPAPEPAVDGTWELAVAPAEEVPDFRPVRSKSPLPFIAFVSVVVIGAGIFLVTQRPELFESVIVPTGDRKVVQLDQTDAGPATDEPTPKEDGGPDVEGVLSSALDAAFAAKEEAEAKRFGKTLEALRPAMDQALGVATEEAEAWADGSALPDMLASAKRALEKGSNSRALSLYRDVLKKHPRNVDAIAGLGWVYLSESRSADAVREFNRALSIDSGHGDAYIGIGSAERQRGNLKAAYDAYDRYLGRHPKGSKASIARYQMENLAKQLGL